MHKMIAFVVVAATTALACMPARAGETPLRERMRHWEMRMIERALGEAYVPPPQPEIVHGPIAVAGKWPFQVALLDSTIRNHSAAFFCGGTLVNDLFVVTAGHCVVGSAASEIDVLTNTQSLTTGGARHKIASISLHPSFDNFTGDYDIAVIKLQKPVTGINVFAKLLTSAQEATLAPTGMTAIVTGWGYVREDGPISKNLRQVQVPFVARRECNSPLSYDGDVTAHMVCAGYRGGGKDACSGDSGGPLIVRDSMDRWQILAGVVSWGEGCARPNLYGVYSRVAVLSHWVKLTIKALGGP